MKPEIISVCDGYPRLVITLSDSYDGVRLSSVVIEFSDGTTIDLAGCGLSVGEVLTLGAFPANKLISVKVQTS